MTPLELNLSVTIIAAAMCVSDPLIQQAKPAIDARKQQTAEAVAKALAQAELTEQAHEPVAIAAALPPAALSTLTPTPLPRGEGLNAQPQEHPLAFVRVVFGLVFLPLFPVLIYFNSYILSYSLEILFDRTGDLLFVLNLGDWSREITDWDMYAALISLSQSIGGAGFYNALGKEDRNWPLLLLTGIGTLALLVFEVGLAINRGIVLAGMGDGGEQFWLNGLGALGTPLIEIAVGVYVLDFLIGHTLTVWRNGLGKLFRRPAAKPPAQGVKPRLRAAGRRMGRVSSGLGTGLLWLAYALDVGIFSPFRAIDRFVARAFNRLLPERNPLTQETDHENQV